MFGFIRKRYRAYPDEKGPINSNMEVILGSSRRELLKRAGGWAAFALIPVLSRCTGPKDKLPEHEYEGPQSPADLFVEGVASGAPLTDAVILWTHINIG